MKKGFNNAEGCEGKEIIIKGNLAKFYKLSRDEPLFLLGQFLKVRSGGCFTLMIFS